MRDVKILTGYSGLGGSTVALINLCNLLNKHSIKCSLHGPNPWFLGKCEGSLLNESKITDNDVILVHFLPQIMGKIPVAAKTILTSHESNVDILRNRGVTSDTFDAIHYVSQWQADFQGIPGVVIPNVVETIKKSKVKRNAAGIIGSIDANKRTHVAIDMALKEFKKVRIYGQVTDYEYFFHNVMPRLSHEVTYCGITDDKKAMYDTVDKVFHASLLETFNLVKAECSLAGIPYLEEPEREQDIWNENRIIDAWKELIDA